MTRSLLILIGLAAALADACTRLGALGRLPGSETALVAMILGLFLGDALAPPWRNGSAGADRAIDAGAGVLAAAFPLLVALGDGRAAPLRGAVAAAGACVAVRLVAITVARLDMRMTSTRVRHHALR